MAKDLTVAALCDEASQFAKYESLHAEPTLHGVTDGKAVGTYLEHKFRAVLREKYRFTEGSSASGIDFPELGVDMKVTSISKPQSSCPYESARQKVFGLGYGLIVFIYNKTDNPKARTGTLDIQHVIFVQRERTADFQMTRGLRQILENQGNEDDLVAFIMEKVSHVDDIEATEIARELREGAEMPQGYLTISDARQWRLAFGRVVTEAGEVEGIIRIR